MRIVLTWTSQVERAAEAPSAGRGRAPAGCMLETAIALMQAGETPRSARSPRPRRCRAPPPIAISRARRRWCRPWSTRRWGRSCAGSPTRTMPRRRVDDLLALRLCRASTNSRRRSRRRCKLSLDQWARRRAGTLGRRAAVQARPSRRAAAEGDRAAARASSAPTRVRAAGAGAVADLRPRSADRPQGYLGPRRRRKCSDVAPGRRSALVARRCDRREGTAQFEANGNQQSDASGGASSATSRKTGEDRQDHANRARQASKHGDAMIRRQASKRGCDWPAERPDGRGATGRNPILHAHVVCKGILAGIGLMLACEHVGARDRN